MGSHQAVGIREFKSRLSEVVRAASRGERFAVTDHGHIVAELGPPGAEAPDLSDIRARVLARGGTAATRPFDLVAPLRNADWQPVDVVGLLDSLRGDR